MDTTCTDIAARTAAASEAAATGVNLPPAAFFPGDTVRIARRSENFKHPDEIWVNPLDGNVGDEGKVDFVSEYGDVRVLTRENCWWYPADCLDLVSSADPHATAARFATTLPITTGDTHATFRESDECYRDRLVERDGVGVHWVEDIGNARGEDLDRIGEYFRCPRRICDGTCEQGPPPAESTARRRWVLRLLARVSPHRVRLQSHLQHR